MVFDSFFDFVFGPVLALPTFWAVLIMSLLISLIITLIYKYTTNQNLMKQLKDEIKELQKEAKELRDKPAEAMKVQKKMMETDMTGGIKIIAPNQIKVYGNETKEVMDGKASWVLKGEKGEHLLEFEYE